MVVVFCLKSFLNNFFISDELKMQQKVIIKQESPPAGNRKRRTDRSKNCPWFVLQRGGVPHPCPGWWVPILTWPEECPIPVLARGYPILTWSGVYPIAFLPGGTPSWPGWRGTPSWPGQSFLPSWPGYGTPKEVTWDQWKYYGIEMGYSPPSLLADRCLWKHNLLPSFGCGR